MELKDIILYRVSQSRPDKSNRCLCFFLFSHEFPTVATWVLLRFLQKHSPTHSPQAETHDPREPITPQSLNRWSSRQAYGLRQATHCPSLRFSRSELGEEKPLSSCIPGSIRTRIWGLYLPGCSPPPPPSTVRKREAQAGGWREKQRENERNASHQHSLIGACDPQGQLPDTLSHARPTF